EMLKRVQVYHEGRYPAYRPFHPDREGMVLGDGASALLLTNKSEHAVGEILGLGSVSESIGLTGVSSDGRALALAIKNALSDAKLRPADITAIVAHGAGTKKGDQAELNAIDSVFEKNSPPITCDK